MTENMSSVKEGREILSCYFCLGPQYLTPGGDGVLRREQCRGERHVTSN